MRWYYVEGETRVGPIEDDEFNERIAANRIGSETLVWNEDLTDWTTLGSLSLGEPDEPSAGEATCSQCLNPFPEADLIRYENLLVCAACKPAFFQKVKEGVRVVSAKPSERYGSVEKGVKGEYDFRISDVLKEAWELTNGIKRHVLGAVILSYAIAYGLQLGFGFLTTSLVGSDPVGFGDLGMILGIQVVSQLVASIILLPMWGGMMMMGVRRAVGQPVYFSLIFSYYNRTVTLLLAYFMYMTFIFIGILLLVIPGIYLMVAYYLSTLLILDKGFGAWRALETSRRAITNKWFKVFGLGLVMILIVMVSAIPLLIGLIWTIPMGCVVVGILYRDIFGVEPLSE